MPIELVFVVGFFSGFLWREWLIPVVVRRVRGRG